MRYIVLSLLLLFKSSLWSANYIVGYQTNNQILMQATLWITTESTTPVSSKAIILGNDSHESQAYGLTNLDNLIYIVGYQSDGANKHATLWIYDTSTQKVSTLTIDSSATDSSMNGIVYNGSSFYLVGYRKISALKKAAIWQIKRESSSSTLVYNLNTPENSELNSVTLYKGILYCAATFLDSSNEPQYAGLYTYDPSNSSPAGYSYDTQHNGGAHQLIVYNNTLYIAGYINNKQATVWKQEIGRGGWDSVITLSSEFSEAFSLVYANNQILVAGTTSDGPFNGAIWSCNPDLSNATGLFQYSSFSSKFNFITAFSSVNKNTGDFPISICGNIISSDGDPAFSSFFRFYNFNPVSAKTFKLSPPTSKLGEAYSMLVNIGSASTKVAPALRQASKVKTQVGHN